MIMSSNTAEQLLNGPCGETVFATAASKVKSELQFSGQQAFKRLRKKKRKCEH